ncbi:MAG TPA: ABC transporter substrate-binding protein [Symbiobacteriaceae bacterium]|nr:ABC transporter substrate-binding protein [Symbiobacteriaceae bacterium]
MRLQKGLALTLALSIAVLAGCGGTKKTETAPATTAPETKAPVEIAFWHGMDPKSAHGATLEKLVAQFNETHKDIVVKPTFQGSYADLETKLTSALAAKTPPAVVQNTDSMLTKLVTAKTVEALDIPASEKSDYAPALLTATTYGDKLYALPFNKSAIVLIYNKKMVQNPPKTWEEFNKVAKDLTKDGKAGTAVTADVYYFGNHLVQAGGAWLSADGKTAAFNSEAGVTALNYIAQQAKDGIALQTKPKEYQSDYFNQGRVGMILTTSASFAFMKPVDGSEWGAAPIYTGPKNAAVPLSGANLSIVTGLKPEQKAAAQTFALWLTGKEGTLAWATAKTGYMPVRKSALETAEWKDFVKANPVYNALGTAVQDGTVQPNIVNWQLIQNEVTTAVQKVFLGQADAKTALDEAAKKANEILAKNK